MRKLPGRTSPPRKLHFSRRFLAMVHVRPASTGVMSSFRSLPAVPPCLIGACRTVNDDHSACPTPGYDPTLDPTSCHTLMDVYVGALSAGR